MIIEVVFEHHR